MSDAIQAPADASSEAPQESAENLEQANGDVPAEGEIRTEAEIQADQSLTKSEKKEEVKRLNSLRLKYNGKEYDEALPFEIPDTKEAKEYMAKHLQMSKLSQTKSQEAAQWQKDATDFLDLLKKDPRSVLSDPSIGLDLKKFAAQIIEEEIENSKKSPEQLELEKIKLELKKERDEGKKRVEDQKKKDLEKIQNEAFEHYETMIDKALEGSDLPKTPYTVKKMADWMLVGLEKGIELSGEDVLSLVREEMHSDLKEMFAAMPEDVIESLVGRENINKIRKKNLAKAKAGPQVPQPVKSAVKDVGKKAEKVEAPAVKKNFKDFFGI